MISIWESIAECRLESEAVLQAYTGGDFIDVGAFHGWYSVLLAHRMRVGDHAVSVEPDSRAQSYLLSNFAEIGRMFPSVRFVLLPLAAGDGSATRVSFHHGEESHPSFTCQADTGIGSSMRSITIDSLVDALHLEPAFVKIDVEGAESFVLDGMMRTLAMFRPS